jgi:murein DD-endopeptidase MepM/ murein hydrolase activator NlpD
LRPARSRFRGAIAATIAATLLIPAVGSVAGPKKELQKNQRELQRVRRTIEAFSSREETLSQEVDRLNSELTVIQMHVVNLNDQIDRVREELREAQAQIDATQAQIDHVESIAQEQAVALYMDGGTDTIDALLDSASLGELDEKAELMGVASVNNSNALVKYGRLRAVIEAQNRVMLTKSADLSRRRSKRVAVLQKLSSKRELLHSKVSMLRKQLGIKESKEAHLESESASIRDAILEHQAKNAVAALGTSNEGFIWPVNGGVTSYYGPRWGRMHTGIDIDAVTGQPIVAAKEGTVILASAYSGYGNAVIIDHGGGYSTLYGHMSAFNTSNGASVDQGDIIGYVGCTGSCTGDHLHFEVRVNGEPVDPMPYLP